MKFYMDYRDNMCNRQISDPSVLDAYPCRYFKCNSSHQYFGIERLYEAIYNLNISRIRTLLDTEYNNITDINNGINQKFLDDCDDKILKFSEKFATEAIDGILTTKAHHTYNFSIKTDKIPPLFDTETRTEDSGLVINEYNYKESDSKSKIPPLTIVERVGNKESWTMNIKKSVNRMPNLLEYIADNLSSYGGGPKNSLASVNYIDIRDYPTKCSVIKILEIIELIASKFPQLITDKIISYADNKNASPLIKIYTQYYINKTEDSCFICYSSHKSELLNMDRFCHNCKLSIHLKCLIQSIKINGTKCTICKTEISVINYSEKFCFPDANIYPTPLMSSYTILKLESEDEQKNINLQLHFAIAYLCVDRVEELLRNITDEQFKNYLLTADYYALHKKSFYGLKDMPYTNLSRNKYRKQFNQIESLLRLKVESISS